MKKYGFALLMAALASPASAQTLPPTIVLPSGLVQEIFIVLNASGTANATVARLQAEVAHQPAPPATAPVVGPVEPRHIQPDK